MQLDRGQTQLLCDLGILNSTRLLERHSSHEFRQVTAGSDGGTAAESLELHVGNRVGAGVDADLEFHDIAAGWGAHEAGADVGVGLGHAADIAGVGVVVEDFFVV